MTLAKQINDLCLQIKKETDGAKLLQLIDQLDALIEMRPKLSAIVGEKKPSARSRQTA